MTRLAILLSGRGSNFQAIHRAIVAGELDATISCVVSNVPEAGGVAYAREHGIPTHALESKGRPRLDFDRQVMALLAPYEVDLICLAGYMRILSPEFIREYPARILNIHPSLLPDFKGLHAQKQALESGVKVAGCTVHYVDEGLDSGPIIAQGSVPVLPGDTEETLSARILIEEHKLYPRAIQMAIAHLANRQN